MAPPSRWVVRVVVEQPSGQSELELLGCGPATTVADVASALGLAPEQGLVVGGQLAGPHLALGEAGVRHGQVLRSPGDDGAVATPGRRPEPDLVLAARGGLVAGPTWPVPVGSTRVGRDPGNDVVLDQPTVSGHHCTLTVDAGGQALVTDHGSLNGTWVDGEAVGSSPLVHGAVIRVGAVLLSLEPAGQEPAVEAGPPGGEPGPTVDFNRPPRRGPPRGPAPLSVPAPPVAPPAAPLSLVSLVAPLVMAAVMVAVLGRLVYALFALLGPVMAVGTWAESRRRSRRVTRAEAGRLAAEVGQLRSAAGEAARLELARRRGERPHPAQLLRQATAPTALLWERRGHHEDFLRLHVGTGDLEWQPPLAEQGGGRPDGVDEALAQAGQLRAGPVGVDLAGAVVGVVGDRGPALALARSLVCQAATQSGPADLAVAVLTDAQGIHDWDWAKWLPHTRCLEGTGAARLLSGDRATSDALLRSMLDGGPAASAPRDHGRPPVTMVVVDDETLARGAASPARAVLRGEGAPAAGVVLGRHHDRLPAVCTTVVELVGPDGEARLLRPGHGETVERFLAAGVEEPVARRWARHLARYQDPEAPRGAGQPEDAPLVDLLGFDAFDPRAVAETWTADGDGREATTLIGVTGDRAVTVDLGATPHLLVAGPPRSGRSEVLRTAAAGLAARLGPDRLRLALFDVAGAGAFAELARLPHVVGLATGPGSAAPALARVEDEVRARRGQRSGPDHGGDKPRLVVVLDDLTALDGADPSAHECLARLASSGPSTGVHLMVAGGEEAATVGPGHGWAEVRLARAGLGSFRAGGPAAVFRAAAVSTATPDDGGAVQVAPFLFGPCAAPRGTGGHDPGDDAPTDLTRLVEATRAAVAGEGMPSPPQLWDDTGPTTSARSVGLPELLGAADVAAIDPGQTWRPRPDEDRLRVPVGVTPAGDPLCLDLKEAALGGMGPHGLVIGATGSGKSELLRTLVAALAVNHGPDQLCLVLVDFKGGASFSALAGLPHVAGLITNLQDDLALVDRMHDALHGEQRRRQELLRRAGNLASAHEYEQRRASGTGLKPLPSLLVVVDEFAELLAARPDFVDLFVAIGRVGRSLGMHLLLASQRLEEGRLRGLESHLGYRVCLRTFSATESRAVLGVPDAHHLPPEPGAGYLKVGAGDPQPFRAAYASAPHSGPVPATEEGGHRPATALDVTVSRLRRAGSPAHQVWLPPLPPLITLDRVLPPLVEDGCRGLVAEGWPGVGRVAVPVGLVDKPRDQAQHLLVCDLSGAEGNLAVVGGPQSGKTTFLRTLLSSLVLTHTPAEARLYCLDLGGGGLSALVEAPHVAAVAGRLDPERVRRVAAEVEAVLARRERLFHEHGLDSAAGFRALRAGGLLPEDEPGDVFVVVDNWAALRQVCEQAEEVVADVAARGLGFGVHVVVTANHWSELRGRLRDSFGGRLELRLNEPAESALDRRGAANLARDVPGRGLTKDGLQFQACLPRVDGRASTEDLQPALANLVGRARAAWPGPPAPPVRLLPRNVPFTDLPGPATHRGRGVPVGLAGPDLEPVHVDLGGADPHFVVFGDGESGKTGFLKTFLTGLTARCGPHQASLLVVDYRRSLLDAVPPGHLLGYAGAAPAAAGEVARLREVLAARLPGPDVPAHELRQRSWWSGPDLYVVVDDYDLVAGAGANPLAPLLDLLAQGRDVGLHLVLARRVAGASRALFEPVLQRVKELGSPGLILSGDASEGPLLGPQRASPQVPGRGLLVRRKHPPVLVQVAWVPV